MPGGPSPDAAAVPTNIPDFPNARPQGRRMHMASLSWRPLGWLVVGAVVLWCGAARAQEPDAAGAGSRQRPVDFAATCGPRGADATPLPEPDAPGSPIT